MEQYTFDRIMTEVAEIKQLLVIIARSADPKAFKEDEKKSEV